MLIMCLSVDTTVSHMSSFWLSASPESSRRHALCKPCAGSSGCGDTGASEFPENYCSALKILQAVNAFLFFLILQSQNKDYLLSILFTFSGLCVLKTEPTNYIICCLRWPAIKQYLWVLQCFVVGCPFQGLHPQSLANYNLLFEVACNKAVPLSFAMFCCRLPISRTTSPKPS